MSIPSLTCGVRWEVPARAEPQRVRVGTFLCFHIWDR